MRWRWGGRLGAHTNTTETRTTGMGPVQPGLAQMGVSKTLYSPLDIKGKDTAPGKVTALGGDWEILV